MNHVCQDSWNQPLGEMYQLYQVFRLFGDPSRVVRGVCPDGLEKLVFAVTLERRLSDQHLVYQYTERPPVNWEGVLLSQQDLMWKSVFNPDVKHTNIWMEAITERHVQTQTSSWPQAQYSLVSRKKWWLWCLRILFLCTCQSPLS